MKSLKSEISPISQLGDFSKIVGSFASFGFSWRMVKTASTAKILGAIMLFISAGITIGTRHSTPSGLHEVHLHNLENLVSHLPIQLSSPHST